jgi:hypothetical protein
VTLRFRNLRETCGWLKDRVSHAGPAGRVKTNKQMTSRSGLRGHRRTYLTILESADHALFKMVRYVLMRPLRPEIDGSISNFSDFSETV